MADPSTRIIGTSDAGYFLPRGYQNIHRPTKKTASAAQTNENTNAERNKGHAEEIKVSTIIFCIFLYILEDIEILMLGAEE
jgi:hypothetical protein